MVALHGPEREDVVAQIQGLLCGESRLEAANWANQWVLDDAAEIDDPRIWKALVRLSGCDLKDGPDSYLLGREDFMYWLSALERVD